MLLSKHFLLCAGLATSAANAYKLAFFNSAGSICGGQALGSWTGGVDSKCSTEFAGLATQVLIKSDRDSDPDNTVIFFKGDDCDSANVVHQGQAGCVEIGGENAPAYDSFKVVKGTIGDEGSKRKRELLEKEERAADVKRTADAKRMPAHGESFEHDNQTWRWHKLSARTWSGVPHDEWDDNIHVENTQDDDEDFQQNQLSQRSPETSELALRSDLDGVDLMCRIAAGCTAVAVAGGGKLRDWGVAAVNTASRAAAKSGKSLFEFLNTPFGSAVGGATVSGGILYTSIYINNRWSPGKTKPEKCVNTDSQADVIKAGIEQITKLTDLEAAQMIIDMKSGEIVKVSISLSKEGDKPICGAPPAKDAKD